MKNLCSAPSIQLRWLPTTCNSSSRKSNVLFGSPGTCTHKAYTNINKKLKHFFKVREADFWWLFLLFSRLIWGGTMPSLVYQGDRHLNCCSCLWRCGSGLPSSMLQSEMWCWGFLISFGWVCHSPKNYEPKYFECKNTLCVHTLLCMSAYRYEYVPVCVHMCLSRPNKNIECPSSGVLLFL